MSDYLSLGHGVEGNMFWSSLSSTSTRLLPLPSGLRSPMAGCGVSVGMSAAFDGIRRQCVGLTGNGEAAKRQRECARLDEMMNHCGISLLGRMD